MTGRPAQALLVAASVALLAAGCAEPRFEQRGYDEIGRAIVASGLEICAEQTEEPPEDIATDRRSFRVSADCAAEDADEETVVDVVAWPDQAARDEAIRRFEAQSRPTSQSSGVQLALGQFTIDVSVVDDEDVADQVVDALQTLGAT